MRYLVAVPVPATPVRLYFLLPLCLVLACVSPKQGDRFPVYRKRPTLGGTGVETDVVWPFYSRETSGGKRMTQVRPLFWREDTPGRTRIDVLGPIVRYADNGTYRRLRIIPNVYYTARLKPPHKSWWLVVFPFLFLGNDDFLVFPVAGVSHGLLGLDSLLLVTPFYARVREGRFVAHDVLFPFISWGSDRLPGGRRRFRIAPFYGESRQRDGTKSGFLFWPFYTWRHGPNEDAFLLFPFYGRRDTPTVHERTYFYPFFHTRRDDLTGDRETALWPFWRRAGGSNGLYVRRLWPFHEFRRTRFTTTEFVLWPFWRREYIDDDHNFGKLTWVLPFYRRVEYVSKPGGAHSVKTILWPAARWETHPDGSREVQILSVLPFDAPALREMFSSFRPFVTLYRRDVDAHGDRDVSYLFGLIQARKTPTESQFKIPLLYSRRSSKSGPSYVRLLEGLFGVERDSKGRYLRLLWGLRIRVGDAG